MKLMLLLNGKLGMSILQFLQSKYPDDIGVVVTVEEDAIYNYAAENGVNTCVYADSAQTVDYSLKNDINVDLGCMIWWPFIIKEPLISFPKQGFINAHPALLPFCRGSMCYFWAIVESAPYGVSIHRVDEKVDNGELLLQAHIPVSWIDTDETLYHASIREIEQLFINNYHLLRAGELASKDKGENKGTYHTLKETENAIYLDLDTPTTLREVLNLVRARSYPYAPGCWFMDSGKRYEIRASITEKINHNSEEP